MNRAAWFARIAILWTGVTVFSAPGGSWTQAQKNTFHRPAALAEVKLDEILRLSDSDNNLFEFVLKRPWYDPNKDTGHGKLSTLALLKAVASAEKKLVQEQCGGKYLDGEIYGLDFRPLTRAQDQPDSYLYRIEKQTGKSSIVSMAWSEGDKEPSTYRLLLLDGHWTLDGIKCPENTKFIMRYRSSFHPIAAARELLAVDEAAYPTTSAD